LHLYHRQETKVVFQSRLWQIIFHLVIFLKMKTIISILALVMSFSFSLSAQKTSNPDVPYTEWDILKAHNISPKTTKKVVAPDFELEAKEAKRQNPFQTINDLGEVFIYDLAIQEALSAKPSPNSSMQNQPIQKTPVAGKADAYNEFVFRAQMLELKQFDVPQKAEVVAKNH
jgi:hypothetical protein